VRTSFALIAVLIISATLGNGLPDFARNVQAAGVKHAAPDRHAATSAAKSTGASPMRLTPASSGVAGGSVPPAVDEVPGLRTRTSRTYLVNGEYQAVLYSGSVNYQDSSGVWQPIDDSLVASSVAGYAWQNKANQYSLLLPSTLSAAPISFQSPGGSVKLQLAGAGGNATVAGATVTYASALPGIAVSLTAENDAMKEAVTLSGPQSAHALVYSMTLSPGLQASATAGGGVAITDSSGKEQFGFDPPTMVDASGAEAPASAAAFHLGTSASGDTVTIALDSSWLGNSLRQFPVTIDPSIHYTADQDCAFESGSGANTNYCGSGSHLTAGYAGAGSSVQRSALLFNVQNAIPAGAQVTHASVDLYLDSTSTSSYANVDLFQLTQPWTTAVTWNDYDGSHAWTTAGGTYNATALAGKTPSTAGWYEWGNSATSLLAQDWLNGTTPNDGLLLRAATESNTEVYTFESTRQTNLPVLNVFYVDALGQRYGTVTHQLTDRSSLAVNVANGNLAITGADLAITGTGLNLSVDRTDNSLGDYTLSEDGAFGTWLMGSGADEHLSVVDNHVDFQGPGGWDETFYSNGSGGYTPPPGADASLVANGDGTYTLTYDATAEQLHFSSAGTLTSDVDSNGDTITYTSSGGNLSSITDTQGRQVTFTYGSSVGTNLITKMTDATARTWQYLYASANGYAELTQYTDPAGKVTHYAYGTGGRITKVTDALGNQTNFAYDSQFRVTSITYVTNTVNQTGPTFTYGYHPNVAGSCAAAPSGDSLGGYTVATDANGHATTYCYDLQGLVLQTIDPDSATNSASYTSDQLVAKSTDALSQTTTDSFNSNNDLTQVSAPVLGSGQNAATAGATYNTPSTVTGYQYLPSSVTDPEGNCTAYVYDTAGNVTDTYAAQIAPCDGHTGGIHTGSRYQGDPGVSCGAKTGQLCSVISGNGGTTSYGYDSNGNLTSVVPPSPAGATTSTVDALSRVLSVTDGKAQKTTYSYDTLDRVTQILYNGATTCTPSTGNCITYVYDADGNRQSMTDQSGTTSYYYDALNRGTTESLPDVSSICAGSSPAGITYTYDGVGNLLTYCDSGGTTTYTYDPDNRLLSIAEPGGSCGSTPTLCTTFGYNADGNRRTITFPGGATETTGFDNAQNVTSVVGKSSTATTLTSFAYTYANGSNDTPLVQTATENDPVASNTYTFAYDALNRLTGASVTSGTGTAYSYAYDSDSNMLSRTAGTAATTYAYNGADQLCWAYVGTSSNPCATTPTGATTYSFDANGNLSGTSAGASFSYNGKNQTTAITNGGTTLSAIAYSDGGQQQRIAAGSKTFDNGGGGVDISTTSGASTYYLRDNQGNLLGERIGSVHYYYLTDKLGSVVAVISGDGQTVSDRTGYDPYGNITYTAGSITNPFGYAGGYTDATGLVQFGARYYDPTTARWTQIDPAGTAGSSAYVYADDNPINMSDPSGEFPGLMSWYCNNYPPFGPFGIYQFHHFGAHFSRFAVDQLITSGNGVGAILGALVGGLICGPNWRASLVCGALGAIVGFFIGPLYLELKTNWGRTGLWLNVTWFTEFGFYPYGENAYLVGD
jgi:RHS repeat-associated protein